MLSPCFIPESVFYTQSVMFSPRFIPESVLYTQSVVCIRSIVRSPQSMFYTDRQIIALFLDCVTRSGYLARDQNLPRSNFFPRLNIVVFKLRKLKISTFLHCIKRNSASMYRSSKNTKISFILLEQKRSKPSPAFFNVQIQLLRSVSSQVLGQEYTWATPK